MWHRFYATLTLEELETCASGAGFPDPIPNRSSSLDTLDRESLLKLWEEDEQKFGGRKLTFEFERQFNLTRKQGTVSVKVRRPSGRIEVSVSLNARAS